MIGANRIYGMGRIYFSILTFPIRGKGLEWKDFPQWRGKEPDEEV